MKKFLKITSIVLVIALVAVFAACGAKDDTNTDEKTTLVMATNAAFPPYEYKEGDNFAGIDIEIAQAIADKLGMTLEIKDVEFGSIVGGVQTGKFDMGIAGMTVTDERLESVNFSTSYATGIQVVIVTEDSAIKSVDDLFADGATYKAGVQLGTTGDIYATDDYGDENIERYSKGTDAVAALVAGKIDCVIIDNEPAKAYVAANEGLEILETALRIIVEDHTRIQKIARI